MIFHDGVVASVLNPLEVIVDVEDERLLHFRQQLVLVHHRFGITHKRAERTVRICAEMKHTAAEFSRTFAECFVVEPKTPVGPDDQVRHIDDRLTKVFSDINQRLVETLPRPARRIRYRHADALVIAMRPPLFRRHGNGALRRPVGRATIAGVVEIKFSADANDIGVEDRMSVPEIPAT